MFMPEFQTCFGSLGGTTIICGQHAQGTKARAGDKHYLLYEQTNMSLELIHERLSDTNFKGCKTQRLLFKHAKTKPNKNTDHFKI
jgi:hypothetical protein